MAKKKRYTTKEQLILDLDIKVKALEASYITRFVRKVKGWINKIINNDNNVFALGAEEINGLRIITQSYFKDLGALAITETNKELKNLVKNKRVVTVPDSSRIDLSYLAKEKAIEKVRAFQKLVRENINKLPATGKEKADIQRAIRGSIKLYRARHIETPAQTEAIDIVNTQRLESFKRSRIVQGVQFLAVLDNRTTDICTARNGKILKLTSHLLAYYTPPLHFNCRSYLSPVTIYEKNIIFASTVALKDVPDPLFDKSGIKPIKVRVKPRFNLKNLIQPGV